LAFQLHSSLCELDAQAWDALNIARQPFLSHAYLMGLEQCGVVQPSLGWRPRHLSLWQEHRLVAAVPLYEKHHSWGEFIVDHLWAALYGELGKKYYPKLLAAVPWTPVSGRRLLGEAHRASQLLEGMEALARQQGYSTIHLLFCAEQEARAAQARGWLIRRDWQFNWHNQGYRDFASYLAAFRAHPRRNVLRERKILARSGIEFAVLPGEEATRSDLDAFYAFYRRTFLEKSGFVPFPRRQFTHWQRKMPEELVFLGARRAGVWVGGAIAFQDESALYGRYWGCLEPIPFLHFEVCYHQGIEYCIGSGRARMEPGAHGEFKIRRGFRPEPIYSAHWIANAKMASLLRTQLLEENAYVGGQARALNEKLPFHRGSLDQD
jgi:predicted N-acyltransferase